MANDKPKDDKKPEPQPLGGGNGDPPKPPKPPKPEDVETFGGGNGDPPDCPDDKCDPE